MLSPNSFTLTIYWEHVTEIESRISHVGQAVVGAGMQPFEEISIIFSLQILLYACQQANFGWRKVKELWTEYRDIFIVFRNVPVGVAKIDPHRDLVF